MQTKEGKEVENNNQTGNSFEQFEDLARKLANVPKSEIDAIDPLVQKRKKQKPAKK